MSAKIPIDIVVNGASEAKTAINGVKESFLGAAKSMLSAYAGFEVLKKITEYMIDARKESQELAKANLQLKAALGFTSLALDEQADALSRKYLMGVKDIKNVQDRIAFFTQEEKQIVKLTPAILNYAAAVGIDGAEATMRITRALEAEHGQIRQLPGKLEGTAGSAERLESIIRLLTARFHDQSEAVKESKDFFDELGFSWSKMREILGTDIFGKAKARELSYYENRRNFIKKFEEEMPTWEQAAFRKMYEADLKLVNEYEQKMNVEKKKAREEHHDDAIKNLELDPRTKAQKKADEDAIKEAKEAAKKKAEDEREAAKQLEKERIDGVRKAGLERVKLLEEINGKEVESSHEKADLLKQSDHEAIHKRVELYESTVEVSEKKTAKGRMKILKQEHDQELALYKDGDKRKVVIAKAFSQEEIEIARKDMEEKISFQLDYTSNALSMIDQIAEATKANAQVMKRIKEGEAIISGAKGVLGVIEHVGDYTAAFGGPIGGGIAMAAEIALIVGLTAAQISKIESAKMAYGGIVTGGVPGQDSVNATLMPGEAVWNPMHPNQDIANYISNTGGNTSHMHVYGPTININGTVDTKTLKKISQTTRLQTNRAVHQAIRELQYKHKLTGISISN